MRITKQRRWLSRGCISDYTMHIPTDVVISYQCVEFAAGRTLKMTTELFGEVSHTFHADLQLEGDLRYSCFKVHMHLLSGLLHGTRRIRCTILYEPETSSPPLDIIATAHPRVVALSASLYADLEFQSSLSASTESTENLTETVLP